MPAKTLMPAEKTILTARAAVLELHVKLGKRVALENGSISHITLAPSLNNVPYLESLDCLVLGHTACTVCASDDWGVPTTLLAPAIITSLLGHAVQKIILADQTSQYYSAGHCHLLLRTRMFFLDIHSFTHPPSLVN